MPEMINKEEAKKKKLVKKEGSFEVADMFRLAQKKQTNNLIRFQLILTTPFDSFKSVKPLKSDN